MFLAGLGDRSFSEELAGPKDKAGVAKHAQLEEARASEAPPATILAAPWTEPFLSQKRHGGSPAENVFAARLLLPLPPLPPLRFTVPRARQATSSLQPTFFADAQKDMFLPRDSCSQVSCERQPELWSASAAIV